MEHQTIRDLVKKATDYGLDFDHAFDEISDEEIAAAYNGIGPEWMPADLRARLTADLSDLEPAALIHDIDYQYADGSPAAFHAANERLRENIRRTADKVATPFFNPKWWKLLLAAALCFDAVERFGFPAYKNAVKNQNKRNIT